MFWGPIQNGVYGPQEDGPRLVVETDDDTRSGKVGQEAAWSLAPKAKWGNFELEAGSNLKPGLYR